MACSRLAGLIGPIVGNLSWRLIGVVGYGVVFPIVCLLIGGALRQAVSADASRRADEPALAATPTAR